MKKYSTLLLSSTILLASLASSPLAIAEEQERTTEQSETTTTVTTTSQTTMTTTTEEDLVTQPKTTTKAATESAPANQLNQSLTTQQNGNTLSIFYKRSEAQKNLNIDFAIWSSENGQDDLRWIRAKDYQTDISLSDFKSGLHIIHSYITINNKPVLLQGSSVTITKPKPSLTASISEQGVLDVVVQNIPSDVKEVLLPTWSNVNGQDDIRWYKANRQADGRYTLRVYLKNHKFDTGAYSIHLYTRDDQSNLKYINKIETTISSKDVPSDPKPTIAIENLQTKKGTYQVTIQETATCKPIKSIQVASWSMDKQANIKWRTASLKNGKYQVSVDFQEQQSHTGQYRNHVYITYNDDSRIGYVADTIDLSGAQLPIKFSSKLTSVGQMQVTFSNIYDNSPVKYAVWSDENGQDDIKWYNASKSADKTYTGNIPLMNHKGVGKYHVHAYQGSKGLGAFTMNITSTQKQNPTPNTYPVGECTWGAKEVATWAGNYWGNGGQWAASARAAGFRTGTTPQVGAIAVWTGGTYGHVAVVTHVESNTRIRVKESNYAGKRYVGDFRGWFNPVADGVTAYIYPN